MEPEVQAKGVNFLGLLQALEVEVGQEAVVAAKGLLEGEAREAFDEGRILAASWYPVGWYRELHRAIQQAHGGGRELARRLGRQASLSDFTGVYRFVARVLSPHTLFSLGPRVMDRYWRGYRHVKVEEARAGFARATFAGFRGFDALVWADVIGGSTALLEVCGAEAVRVHIVGGGRDGDDDVLVEARWVLPS